MSHGVSEHGLALTAWNAKFVFAKSDARKRKSRDWRSVTPAVEVYKWKVPACVVPGSWGDDERRA